MTAPKDLGNDDNHSSKLVQTNSLSTSTLLDLLLTNTIRQISSENKKGTKINGGMKCCSDDYCPHCSAVKNYEIQYKEKINTSPRQITLVYK